MILTNEEKKAMYLKYGFTEEEAEKAIKNEEKIEKWKAQRKAMEEMYHKKTGKRKK